MFFNQCVRISFVLAAQEQKQLPFYVLKYKFSDNKRGYERLQKNIKRNSQN
jgi:hypothetical protein